MIATSMSLHSHVAISKPRNPRVAAALSACPGLGQLYNGELAKGMLFLACFAGNMLLLNCIVFHAAIVNIIGQLARLANLQIDPASLQWFASVPQGSPFLAIYTALIMLFVAYSMREAYVRAAKTWQGVEHPKFFLGLPEAASGSYLGHFILIFAGLVGMLFVALPKEPTEQVTEIQLMPPPPAPPPPKAKQPEPAKPKASPPEAKKPVVPPPVAVKPQVTPPPIETPAPPVAASPPAEAPVAAQPPGNEAPAGSGTPGGTGTGAAGAGDSQDVDFGPYLAEMQKRIKKNWFPPRGNESKRITVKFKIHKNGEITAVKLEKSSGLSLADDAALEAIEKVSPLPPLPAGSDPELTIKFTFDYNVFNGSNQSAAGAGAVSN